MLDQFSLKNVSNPLDGIESECFADGAAKIGIRVDVEEDTSTVRSFEILNPRDIHPGTLDDTEQVLLGSLSWARLGGVSEPSIGTNAELLLSSIRH